MPRFLAPGLQRRHMEMTGWGRAEISRADGADDQPPGLHIGCIIQKSHQPSSLTVMKSVM